jgi:hypothetical protein
MSTEGLERRKPSPGASSRIVRSDQSTTTPCQSWKVRNVITHIVGGNYWFAPA